MQAVYILNGSINVWWIGERLELRKKILHNVYLKPKVTLHCYNIYLFWVLVSGILNVFDSYWSSINYSYVNYISCFCCHKCNHNALMKEAWGQNKLFQNASILMCYCSFAIGQFSTLKNQFARQTLELLFKVKISANNPSSNTKSCVLRTYPFLWTLQCFQWNFP